MPKSTYTEDNFEEYSSAVIARECEARGWEVNESAEEGSIQNNRDDAFKIDGNGVAAIEKPAYTDEDIWEEYVYFLITEGLDDYLSDSWLAQRMLAAVHDDQEETYEMYVYRDDDKPYSHYDVSRMDLYRGSYHIDDKGHTSYTFPQKVVFDV